MRTAVPRPVCCAAAAIDVCEFSFSPMELASYCSTMKLPPKPGTVYDLPEVGAPLPILDMHACAMRPGAA